MSKASMRGLEYLLGQLDEIGSDDPIIATPMPYQQEVIDTFEKGVKFLLICWCRRLGKDYVALIITLRECITKPNQTVFYVFPTMDQGKKMILNGKTNEGEPLITSIISPRVLIKARSGKIYHHDNTLRFKNGSIIYFVDANDADTKVGGNLNLLVLSEMALYKNQNILEYLIPSTVRVGGRIICVSTPRYGSKFNDMVMNPREGTFCSVIPVSSPKAVDNDGNKIYDDELMAEVRRLPMSDEKYAQEYECDFDTANESSIYSKTLQKAVQTPFLPYMGKRIVVSLDLGINDGTSMIFSTINDGKATVVNWYYTNNQPSSHYVEEINKWAKLNNVNRSNIEIVLPHDGANRHDGGTHLTSREMFWRKQGFTVKTLKPVKVLQGIEICRSSIQRGDVQFESNAIVSNMLNDLKKYEYKTTNGIIEYTPIHGKGLSASNIADSLEYLCIYLFKDRYLQASDNFYGSVKSAQSKTLTKPKHLRF